MSKIEKTIARQKERCVIKLSFENRSIQAHTPPSRRIEAGEYYEAHQQLRVIAARYFKQNNYNAAIDLLFHGALLLLKAGEGGSGGDLCLFLVDAYNKGEVKPDAATKGKLFTLLRSFPVGEPSKKRFVNEMVAWSARFGEFPAGDPELHHVAGSIFAEGERRLHPLPLKLPVADRVQNTIHTTQNAISP